MTREEQIALAKKIAQALPEVTRNEWMRWMQVVEKYGLREAIRYAERLAQDITMRPNIKRANDQIAGAVRARQKQLQDLTPEARRIVLGYVAWWLKVFEEEGKAQQKAEEKRGQKTSHRHPRHRARRGHRGH